MHQPPWKSVPLRGRHNLNFDFFLVHWAIILVPVNIYKRSHLIWAMGARKGNTYLPPHSLFEIPVLPLQNMLDLAQLFCYFSINAPIWNWLSVNIKMKRLCATLKNLPQSLTGCCSVSDGENENNPDEWGRRRGPNLKAPSGSAPPWQEEIERWEAQLRDWKWWGGHQSHCPPSCWCKLLWRQGPQRPVQRLATSGLQ